MESKNRRIEDEQAIKALREIINFNDPDMFNLYWFKHVDAPELAIVDSYICLNHEKTTREQKTAAYSLLRLLVNKDALDSWLEGTATVFDRTDRRVLKWRREVLKAGKCAKCGSTKNLQAHHILHWSMYPKGRDDVSNGMCLCDECHAKEHEGEISYSLMMSNIQKRKGVAHA